MKILLVDAYDSFVYIIANYIEVLGCDLDVVRCDKVDIDAISTSYTGVILGPGPGHPKASGYLKILDRYAEKLPIFGVCLGMQAIAEHWGVAVCKATSRRHGKISDIRHGSTGCFAGLPSPMKVTRYHSLVADQSLLPNEHLEITAQSTDDGYVMGLKHRTLCVEGVQFHPESVTTDHGLEMVKNILAPMGLRA